MFYLADILLGVFFTEGHRKVFVIVAVVSVILYTIFKVFGLTQVFFSLSPLYFFHKF